MDKKIFVLLFCAILLVGVASALEFDNVKSYDELTKTVTIENAFGFGDDIADVQLLTPLEVIVPRGYQKVAEFKVLGFTDYEDFVKGLEFYDLKKDNEKIDREFDLKLKGEKQVLVDDYSNIMIEILKNGTKLYETQKTGSHYETQITWTKLTPTNLKKDEEVIIGIFTDVKVGDKVDWIPGFAGVKVEEWAYWTESLNVDLLVYYKMDEGSGAVIDSMNNNNATNTGCANTTGILGSAYDFTASEEDFILSDANLDFSGTGEMAWSVWFKRKSSGSPENWILSVGPNAGGGVRIAVTLPADNVLDIIDSGTQATIEITDTNWHHLAYTRDGNTRHVLLDGAGYYNGSVTTNIGVDNLAIGAIADGAAVWWDGSIDEVGFWNRSLSWGEMEDLYNGGLGISFGDLEANPTVNLHYPTNYTNFTKTNRVVMNATLFDDVSIKNATLYLNGVGNETNTTAGVNNSVYTFTKNLADGNTLWLIQACDSSDNCINSSLRVFNITLDVIPVVTLETPNNYTNFTTTNEVDFECLPIDYVNDIVNVSLYIDGALNETNTDGLNDTSAWFNKFLSEGNHSWTCDVYSDISETYTAEVFLLNVDTTPELVLTAPIDYANLTYNNIKFNSTATEVMDIKNVSFYLNGILNETNTSGTSGDYIFSKILADGYYNWSEIACSSNHACNTSGTRNLTIDTTPNIQFETPTYANYSNITIPYIPVNVSLTETYFDNLTFNYYKDGVVIDWNWGDDTRFNNETTFVDGEWWYNVTVWTTTGQSNSTETRLINVNTTPKLVLTAPDDYSNLTYNNIKFNSTLTPTSSTKNVSFYLNGILNETDTSGDSGSYVFSKFLVNGYYNWSEVACSDGGGCNTSETRNLTIDSTLPSITIDAPNSLYTYLYENKSLFFNFTVTDDHLDQCIWNYNGTNYSAACSTGVEFKTVIGQELNDFNVTIYANDTHGNENSATKTWGYQFFETDREYDATTIQTSIEDFILSLLKSSTLSSYSASLIYNNSIYASTTSASGSNLNFSNTIDIPINSANSSFLWNISFTNTTGTFNFNTTTSYQVANNLTISRCYTAYPDSYVLNFTTYDSTNLTALNSTFEMNFYFYSSTGSGEVTSEFLFIDTNENTSNYMFCVNSSSNNVTANAVVSYGATGYDSRQYIIDDGTIYQSIQNISLYLTETALTDIVTVQVQDQGYSPIAGAVVYIQKWNVGTNTYSTVGMFTTSEIGEGIMDLELYTTFYRAVVYYEGTIITTTETQKLSSATWTITIDLAIDSPYDLFGDIIGAVTFDNTTNITSFTWLDSSGYTQRGCLIVKQYTNLGLSTLSSSCTSSVSGTIDYQLLNNGSYIAYGQIYIAEFGIFENIDTLEIYLGTSNLVRTISPFGKVISALVIGTMGMIGVAAGSAILGSILLIAGLFLLSWIGFLNISSGFIWGMITIAIIIIALQRRRK